MNDAIAVSSERRIDPDGWADAVAPVGRPQIVVGGPGTGKTSFLCDRIAAAVASGTDPSEIVVLTFSRRGVVDLKNRLGLRLGNTAHRITVATHHSLAMRLVEAHSAELGWGHPPALLPGAEQEQLVANLLEREDPADWPASFRPILATTAMAADVTDFILRNHEQLGTPASVAEAGRDQWRALPHFLERYDDALHRKGRIDYGLVIADAVRLLEADSSVSAFTFVAADEYQDTSPVQARLLMALGSDATDLVVAADPYQSIYSFRGADINNVFDFPARVREELGEEAERLVLTTSFRVPVELLDAAVSVTARELPGGAGKVLSTRSGGSVSCHEFPTNAEEAEWIATEVERLHLTEGIALERMAAFTRSHGSFVDDLARSLERRGIAHTETEERLADERVIRFLHDIVTAAVAEDDVASAALRRVLLGPFVRLGQGQVSRMPDGDVTTLSDWIRGLGPHLTSLADLLDEPSWCTEAPASIGLWHVWSSLPQLARVATDDPFDRDRRAWSAYAQVLDRLGRRDEHMTLEDHAALSARFDFEADSLFSVDDAAGITIGTLHTAKGTEFDVVFIADAVEGALPDLRAKDSLLGVRHLNASLPTATADYVTFRLDEERRLAYTAMTRSTGRVVWTATAATDEGNGSTPSRFMRLVAETTTPASASDPLTPTAMIAKLHRVLADPEAAAVDRLAALGFLSAQPTATHPLDRYGTRRSGPDHGVITTALRLSPSQAKSYQDCPRKYVSERYLLSAVDESVHMRLGTLLHTVLERAEQDALDRGDERSTAAAALVILDEIFDNAGFGDDSVAAAWKRRAATLVTNLYENWPSAGAPVLLEIDLEADIDGTPWRGRADRIERSGTSLTVVDYKSGRTATLDEAKTSIQLGFYALAAMEDPRTAGLGTVDAAEFWFPKEVQKRGIATRSLDMDQLDTIRAAMVAIASAINAEQFAPTPGSHCRNCPVTSTCPALPQGAEAFQP